MSKYFVQVIHEVRERKRDLAVAFYDYRKAYDKVRHDWMVMVYDWMGVPNPLIN